MGDRTRLPIREQVDHVRHGSVYVIAAHFRIASGHVEYHDDEGFIGSSGGTLYVYFSTHRDATVAEAESEPVEEFVDGLRDPDEQFVDDLRDSDTVPPA